MTKIHISTFLAINGLILNILDLLKLQKEYYTHNCLIEAQKTNN